MKITRAKSITYDKLKCLQIKTPETKPEIPSYRYLERLNLLRKKMDKNELDAVVVYADREHYSNFKFLLGYDPRFEEAIIVINKEDPSFVLLGNECFILHKLSPISIKPLLCQVLSLPNQPMDKYESMEILLEETGLRAGQRIGLVGWKLFTDRQGNICKNRYCVPSFITDAVHNIAGISGKVVNATDLFISPEYGFRLIHDVDTIAAYEYGASYASDAIKVQQEKLHPGITEAQLVNYFVTNGQVLACHPFALAQQNADKGMINSSDYVIKLGDGLNLCAALEGGLSCRHAYVAQKEEDLPIENRDYMDLLVKPYYAALVSWYENMKIGTCGGDIFDMIQTIFPQEEYGWALNAGHFCSSEEWISSPFYKGSKCIIRSGMIIQMDIIPVREGYHGPNAEDGVCIADETLRAQLQEKYPEVYARMQQRRKYMIEQIGIQLPEEVLPMSNLAGEFRPYIMNLEMGMVVN